MIPKFLPDSHVLHYSDSREAHSFSTAKRYLQTARLVFIHLVSSAPASNFGADGSISMMQEIALCLCCDCCVRMPSCKENMEV